MKHHGSDYFGKPRNAERKVISLGHAVKMTQQHQLAQSLFKQEEPPSIEALIGRSPAMERIRGLIRRAGPRDGNVLIVGESGTGKELIAKAVHDASGRVGKPFVDVNCAALTESLIESELFGHQRGAFTGAIAHRRGKFEQANGGTLFLDEIGDMPLAIQAKILRVLQEQSFQRVGGEEQISVNVRIICATNHNLQAAIQQNSFRMDLFYRINVMVIEVPPLRERLSDVPELAQHFFSAAFRSGTSKAQKISEAAIKALSAHNWPGNVRELENAIERAMTICDDDEIQPSHLPPTVLCVCQPSQPIDNLRAANLVERVKRYERAMIFAALTKCDWNNGRAADALKITRRILAYKMKNLEIKLPPRENHAPPAEPEVHDL